MKDLLGHTKEQRDRYAAECARIETEHRELPHETREVKVNRGRTTLKVCDTCARDIAAAAKAVFSGAA